MDTTFTIMYPVWFYMFRFRDRVGIRVKVKGIVSCNIALAAPMINLQYTLHANASPGVMG